MHGSNSRSNTNDPSRNSTPGADTRRPNPRHEQSPRLDRLKRRLQTELGSEGFERYFGGGERLELSGSRLDVRVPDRFTASLIDRRFGERLRRALQEELGGEPGASVSCRVDQGVARERRKPAEPASAPPRDRAPRRPRQPVSDQRLEEFVVGEANRVAHSACVQLCDPRSPLQVVFLHSPCGLGKTHLLQGVSARVRQRPGARVRYMTGESFLNAYIARVREGRIDAFQSMFKGLDLLCIDDVQAVLGKVKTQHQLQQAIETVQSGGGRVAMAADTHPREMRELSRALASRFVAGPVIRLDAPDEELRARLVRHRALKRGLPLADEAAQMIAQRASGAREGEPASVRDLEGMLIQVEAVWRLLAKGRADAAIDAPLVARALDLRTATQGDADRGGRAERPVRLERISEIVCREMGVQLGDVLGRGRHKRVVLTRALIVHTSRELTTRSYPEIARTMARNNHSTVITAHQRIARQIEAGERCDVGCAHDGLTIGELAARMIREVRRGGGRG